MAIELKQSLKLSQQLVITPQLQQAIKLLQLSRIELVDLIQNELEENPVLEESSQEEDDEVPAEASKEIETESNLDKGNEEQKEVQVSDGEFKDSKEFDWENYIGTYNNASSEDTRSFNPQEELPAYDNVLTKPTTLQDHLEWQLRLSNLTEHEEEVGLILIGYLDDNGYQTTSLEEIASKNNLNVSELKKILKVIQDFDPIGVAASNLKECLLLQARLFGEDRELIETMIKNYLHLLEKKDYQTLSRKLKVPIKRVIHAAQIISEMEPKPGRPYGRSDTQYITPDVYVYKVGTEYTVVLNEEGLPILKVSPFYRNMLTRDGNLNEDKAKDYVQDKLKSALWLIKSIHQRQRTLYRVSKSIVKFQYEFLDKGIQYLKPMILKDVAEEIGVHESTVSRATTNKYVHTPQGLFELKYFFSSGVAVTSGQEVASETVKEKIKILISNENLKKPLSDKEIAATLREANIDIARRTVAKYREILGILPSSKRKRMY